MNVAYQLLKPKEVNLIQSVYPPKPVKVYAGKVLSTELPNKFATLILDEQKLTPQVNEFELPHEMAEIRESSWKLDIPITVQGYETSSKSHEENQKIVRFHISSELDRPYPQSHKIILMDVIEDIFFNWTFNLTPFTYKSMMKRMKWSLPETAGDQFHETFKRFGYVIRECIRNVSIDPTRYIAKLMVSPDKAIATLIFYEIVNDYRSMELISMDFLPTAWSLIKNHVISFTGNVQQEHETIKTKLVQMMETISIHQPVLLLSMDVHYTAESLHSPEWLKAKYKLTRNVTGSEQEKRVRALQFLKETSQTEEPESVLTKTFGVPIEDLSTKTFSSRVLSFVFFYTRTELGKPCYIIHINDLQDPFFSYKSVPITPEKFHAMTCDIKSSKPGQSSRMSQVFACSKQIFDQSCTFNDQTLSQNLGFHDPTGETGVLGVIANDYMMGVIENPSRYHCKLDIDCTKLQPISKAINLERESHIPIPTTAKLTIQEHTLYQNRSTLIIDFHSAPFENLQTEIKRKYRDAKNQIVHTKSRLDLILKTVRMKNMALYSILEKPGQVSKQKERSIDPEQEVLHYGYDSKWSMKKMAGNLYFKKKEEVRVVPTRSVATMKIPVLLPQVKKEVRKNSEQRYHVRPGLQPNVAKNKV